MQKLIYLARRKPGFTTDEFVCRWRRHGALGMAQPLWRFALGYVQSEPIRPAAIPGASEDYDAIACFMIRDEMFDQMNDADMAGAIAMAEDELETFSAPIPTTSLWVKEEPIRPGELGGITAYLFFEDAGNAREIAERNRKSAGLNRVILNLRDDAARGPDMNTLPYQAIVELSSSSLSSLADSIGPDGQDALQASDLGVITRDAVLWDRLVYRAEAGHSLNRDLIQ